MFQHVHSAFPSSTFERGPSFTKQKIVIQFIPSGIKRDKGPPPLCHAKPCGKQPIASNTALLTVLPAHASQSTVSQTSTKVVDISQVTTLVEASKVHLNVQSISSFISFHITLWYPICHCLQHAHTVHSLMLCSCGISKDIYISASAYGNRA